jgi:hypothetical protein
MRALSALWVGAASLSSLEGDFMRAIALLVAFLGGVVVLPQIARAEDQTQLYVSYAKENHIAANIKNECKLVEELSQFIVEASGGTVVAATGEPNTKKGSVLVVEITDSVSAGNAFIGHRKYTAIQGKLYKGGAVAGNFEASRNSMGGAFAGYKGSCSVLGRTVKTLGSDVNGWLRAPSKDAKLGDS